MTISISVLSFDLALVPGISTRPSLPLLRVREIFDYPKRENLNTRTKIGSGRKRAAVVGLVRCFITYSIASCGFPNADRASKKM